MKVADLFAKLGLKTNKAQFKQGNRMIGAIKTALVGIVAFKTIKWFGSLINDTRQAADEFAKMSKKLGISVEGLQQLEFAAQISGSNLQQLRTGFQRFARNASDAARGSMMAVEAMKDAGVTFKDTTTGGLMPLDAMLMDVADHFQGMTDKTKRTALAQELFGRAGADLIPFLIEGSEGIGKLREEFVELGAQLDGDTAAAFEQLNDDELRVQTALKGIRNQVVVALLPTLQEMVKGLLAWIKANRELIKQKLAVMLKQLVAALKLFAKIVVFVIENWRLLLGLMIGAKVLSGLTKLIILYKTLGSAAFLSGLKAAAGWMMALLPFILLGVLVVAAIALVLDFFGVFGEGETPISRIKEWLVDAFVGWIEDAVRAWKTFFSWLKDESKKVIDALTSSDWWKNTFLLSEKTSDFARAMQRELTIAARGGEKGRQARVQQLGLPSVAEIKREAEVRNQLSATINITVPEGADAEGIANRVRGAMGEFWDSKMREAKAATGQ